MKRKLNRLSTEEMMIEPGKDLTGAMSFVMSNIDTCAYNTLNIGRGPWLISFTKWLAN